MDSNPNLDTYLDDFPSVSEPWQSHLQNVGINSTLKELEADEIVCVKHLAHVIIAQ